MRRTPQSAIRIRTPYHWVSEFGSPVPREIGPLFCTPIEPRVVNFFFTPKTQKPKDPKICGTDAAMIQTLQIRTRPACQRSNADGSKAGP